MLPSVSSMKKCRPSSRPGGRNQRANRVSSSVVKTMCDDDDFWEAVITDFQSSSVGTYSPYFIGITHPIKDACDTFVLLLSLQGLH